ncbi:MAG TPA: hypothetical protein PK629_11075 [Oscillospiraceae bacterium]|nr:hypothetical protein [Oscillospiraceae bacterium]HPF56082.1 hypothetical protein [Clostridiales bacterium]HPK36200.1 hypothetical protein [Oscillospiraceae bacterium]HPR75691.1 hypothetical protein [Oscillospiraceae bacterium]
MNIKLKCPFCKGTMNSTIEINGTYFNCNSCRCGFTILDSIYEMPENEVNKILNLIYEFILRHPLYEKHKYQFYFDNSDSINDALPPYIINIANEFKNYPKNAIEKINRVLINLSIRYPNIGDAIDWSHENEYRLLFCDTENQEQEAKAIINYLINLNYIDGDSLSGTGKILFKGWEKIEELSKTLVKNQGFIAIGYKDTESIIKTIKETIENDCNIKFIAMVISEKQYNGQIVPEIFYEIQQSKFVVVDVTIPNYGAYYEAGYAEALGKPVIVCCRKKEFDDPKRKPHFDIAQKSSVIWEDETDLRERLKKRIEATVK